MSEVLDERSKSNNEAIGLLKEAIEDLMQDNEVKIRKHRMFSKQYSAVDTIEGALRKIKGEMFRVELYNGEEYINGHYYTKEKLLWYIKFLVETDRINSKVKFVIYRI